MRKSYTMRLRVGLADARLLQEKTFIGGTILFRDEMLVFERIVSGENRRHAVTVALNWLWERFGNRLGQAQTLLTVDDPQEEVKYGTSFHCRAREYCYLDDETILRLLEEARGELARETRVRGPHRPYGSVRRVKRRRKLAVRVAPCLYADANNTFFYRYTYVPQHSKNGRFFRYRKVRFHRLTSHDLSSAIVEVKNRNLPALHKSRRVLPGVRSFEHLQSFLSRRPMRTFAA